MAIKKYTNGSWVSASYRKYGTETDIITTLPATVIGDGTPISSYIIKGDMEQIGTPTPSNPIYPSECGEKTENLCDKNNINQGYYAYADGQYANTYTWVNTYYIAIKGNTKYTAKFKTIYDTSRWYGFVWYDSDKHYISTTNTQDNPTGCELTATSPANASFCVFNVCAQTAADPLSPSGVIYFMFNEGTTPLPYEPYGYKLPITLGGTTTNIFLGEVQSTRRIKKLVLTGGNDEDWGYYGTFGRYNHHHFYLNTGIDMTFTKEEVPLLYCDAYKATNSVESINNYECRYQQASGDINTIMANRVYFTNDNYSSEADVRAALVAQPITLWIVMPKTTGTLNEPLMKIGDYVDSVSGTGLATSGTAQEFDVGTALKPSEVDMTYHGWHEHDDTKYIT